MYPSSMPPPLSSSPDSDSAFAAAVAAQFDEDDDDDELYFARDVDERRDEENEGEEEEELERWVGDEEHDRADAEQQRIDERAKNITTSRSLSLYFPLLLSSHVCVVLSVTPRRRRIVLKESAMSPIYSVDVALSSPVMQQRRQSVASAAAASVLPNAASPREVAMRAQLSTHLLEEDERELMDHMRALQLERNKRLSDATVEAGGNDQPTTAPRQRNAKPSGEQDDAVAQSKVCLLS